jgi:hypothetical protein
LVQGKSNFSIFTHLALSIRLGSFLQSSNHRLTSEMLEDVCKDEDVLEVTGEYTAGTG